MTKSIKKQFPGKDLSQITTYQAGIIQAVTNRQLQKYCDEVLKPYGISKMHWLIIGTILDVGEGGIRVTELAEKLDTTMPYLTNTINLLESKNIVERASREEDNRSKFVTINKNFARKCEAIERDLRQKLRNSIYSHIDPDEFRVYMKVMYQLAEIGGFDNSQIVKDPS